MIGSRSSVAVPARVAGTAGRWSGGARAASRARAPDAAGMVERDGVALGYEVFGAGRPTVVLLPTWSIVDSRFWKFQVPYLARHFRVVSFDGRGSGRSGRPAGAEAYAPGEFARDTLAVMDATGTERAVLVALSCGALWGTLVAAGSPERVAGLVYVGPAVALAPNHPERDVHAFEDELDADDGWAKYNRHYWQRDYVGFLEFFFAQCFSEPHSTKQIEDAVRWGLDTTPETLIDAIRGLAIGWDEPLARVCSRVRCPTLVIHGDADRVRPLAQGAALARAAGGELVTLAGAGHLPVGRDPVRLNLLIREFVESLPATDLR